MNDLGSFNSLVRRAGVIDAVAIVLCLAVGCDRGDMYDQPRYDPLEASSFFPDGMSARLPVPGTVARGQLHEDEAFYTGKRGNGYVNELPVKLERQLLLRGQERFNIYCAVCHSRTGDGDGMIVQRGFRRPPTYHSDRLRNAPLGHFYDVITNGFGAMPKFNVQIEPRDRWAIVAYIRALQLSQNARLQDLPPKIRAELEARQ